MSIPLTPFDLSPLAVGQSGSIDLTKIMNQGGLNPGNKPTLRLFNDSGSGLQVNFPVSGIGFQLPAGAWQDVNPQPGESSIDFTVLYLLPNPPVTLLMVTYYSPNEQLPAMPQLGNSPIGGGVTIATANNVSNTGQPPFTSIVYGLPSGDNNALGALNLENSGFGQFGDSIYQGEIEVSGPSGNATTITNDNITTPDLVVGNSHVASNSVTTPKILLTQGSISKISLTGPFTTVVGHITINHGLGAVPDFIFISINSTSTSAHNVYWNNTNSTTLDLYSDGILQVYVLCLKF